MHQTCLSYSKNILWKWRDGLCRESLENTDCCFKVFCCCLVTKSCLRSFVIPWTIARQHPLYMGLSGREYWSGLSFPSLGQVPDPGVEPPSSALASRFFTTEPPGKPLQPFSVPTISWYFYHDKLFMVPCIYCRSRHVDCTGCFQNPLCSALHENRKPDSSHCPGWLWAEQFPCALVSH